MSESPRDEQQLGLIEEYLGSAAAMGGPFALLDLKHDPIDESMVLRACQSRLRAIAVHPRSRTPGADEVRLAVHAAASQLLDHDLCRELAKHWPAGTGDILSHQPLPEAWRVDEAVELDDRILKEANWLIGASGGWNSKSRKRLGFFARVHRVPAAQLISAIVGETQSDSDQQQSGRTRFGFPSVGVASLESMPWFVFPAVYALFAMVLLSVGVARITGDGVVDQVEESRVADSGRALIDEPQSLPGAVVNREPSERRHYSAIVHELEVMGSGTILDADQAVAFSELGERFCEQWTKIPRDDLISSAQLIHGLFSGILNEDHFSQASAFLQSDSGTAYEPMMLTVLRAWLSGSMDQAPQFGGIRGLSGNDFWSVARRVQLETASSSVDDPAWWNWLDEQLGAESVEANDRQRAWLAAGRSGLVGGAKKEAWESCARVFVQGIEWDEGSGARIWYMSQVSDRAVGSDRLAVLSRSLALYSSAQGLNLETLVAADASMEDREAYLQFLRSEWGAQEMVVDEVREQLAEQARTLLRLTEGKMGEAQVLNRGIELARLNSACWARSKDDQASVQLMIQRFNSSVSRSDQDQLRIDLSSDQKDERWADDARNQSDSDELLSLLRDLDRQDGIGPKSAHALVYLAMQAPDLGVRDAAERTLLSHNDEVTVLIALDRVAGSERLSRRMMDLIRLCIGAESGLSDAHSIRRALMEALVRAGVFGADESTQTVGGYIEEYLRLIGVRDRSQGSATTRDFHRSMTREILELGIEIPESLIAELRVGLSGAGGPIQIDVVYMRGVLALFAIQVQQESAGIEARVEQVIRAFQVRMSGADSALEQIMLIERAIAELWLIKLESELIA